MVIKNYRSALIIILLLAAIICLFIWDDALSMDSTTIYSETSVWDLRDLPFESENYKLIGPVEYIPNELLSPGEFAERESEAVIGYPQNASQYATSRIRVLLPEDSYYSFSCRSIDYSESLYVNGRWVLDVGSPGETKETTVPNTGKTSMTIMPENGVIEIVQQASNFVHREGGGHAGWNVGASVLRSYLTVDFYDCIKLGCFLALFFVHMILFLMLRSSRANLFFALFCLFWFLRTGVTGAKVFTELFPWVSWTVKFRIEYLAFPVTASLLTALIDSLFPGILHKWFRYAIFGVSAVIAALFLFADTVLMSKALLWCEAVYIPAIFYIAARLAMKLRAVSPGQGIFLAGIAMFFYAAVHDMLYYNDILLFPVGDLSSVSMLLLTFCEAAAVFIATVYEFDKAKTQEQLLAVENAALKENTRMTERQLVLQAERYKLMMNNIDKTRAARHDLRHQFAVLRGFGAAGDLDRLNTCLDELSGALPMPSEELFCQNCAVNSVVNSYLDLAKANGTEIDALLEIPEAIGRIPDMDLCVVMGNILENAVEACARMECGKRFIRLRSRVQGDYLSLLAENSFDGIWHMEKGIYFSRKVGDPDERREGVGLSSVKAICGKHDGKLRVEVEGNIWHTSALLRIGRIPQE